MPYVALEDVGTTRRRSLSGRRRLQAWERTGGTCVVCAQRIDGVRERWIVEHIRALELGGTDDIKNMGPAHEACGREKTRNDHAHAAAAKRQKIRHLGAVVITRPFPGSRASAFKRKLDGTVVPREDPGRLHTADKLGTQYGSVAASTRKPFMVDTSVKSINRLCTQPAAPAKPNMAGTGDQMANQATSAKPERMDCAQGVDTASGEIIPAIPSHLNFLFSDRPLLPGEDQQHYEALLRSIVQQVKPADVIEAIWLKDITDLIWEARRLRDWRRQILVRSQYVAAEAFIYSSLQAETPKGLSNPRRVPTRELAAGWLDGSKIEKDQVDKLFHADRITAGNIMTHGFVSVLTTIERIDRLASLADLRRDALLREIDRKRASFAKVVRTVAADVIDDER